MLEDNFLKSGHSAGHIPIYPFVPTMRQRRGHNSHFAARGHIIHIIPMLQKISVIHTILVMRILLIVCKMCV